MANQALEQAAGILSDAKQALKSLLEKEYNILFIGFDARLTQMINQINFASGGTLIDVTPTKFEPVTKFMGEKLETPKKVSAADLSPKELERKLFNEKVQSLQKELPNLTNKQIQESYINEPMVIRGLAKRAGVEDYREGEINDSFLDLIRAGFNQQAADAKAAEKDSEVKNENLLG